MTKMTRHGGAARPGKWTGLAALLLSTLTACAQPLEPAVKPEAATNAPSYRTYGQWLSARIGGGGYLQHIVFAPSDAKRMYLSVDVGGLYRSDDGGKTWRMLHGSLPARAGNYSVGSICVDPKNADRLVIATGSRWVAPEGVYVSDDGGESWRQTLKAWFMADGPYRQDGQILVRRPDKPEHLLAGGVGKGVFLSKDGGETWTNVGVEGYFPADIVFDRRDPEHVWLCAAKRDKMTAFGGPVELPGGFFESRDGGETWEKFADDAPREFIQDPTNPAVLYGLFNELQVMRSEDDGRTWTSFNEGLPPVKKKTDYRDAGYFRAIAAGEAFVVLGASNGQMYRLNEAKTGWDLIKRQSVNVGDWFAFVVEPPGRRFGSAMGYIAIDPRDPKHWCFTDWYAMYQSFDAGVNWDLTIEGIEATVIHAVRSASDGVIHMGMGDNGYFRSTDQAVSFACGPRSITNNVKDISISRADTKRLYAVGPKEYQWWANHVFISDDAGLNWRRSEMGGLPDMSKHRCNTVAAGAKLDEVWLGVSGKVKAAAGGAYRSIDGGMSWKWVGEGLPVDKDFFRHDIWVVGREMAVSPDGTVLAASNAVGGVYRLADPAGRWEKCDVRLSGKPHDLVASPEAGRFYLAAAYDGVHATADGGKTWQRLYKGSVYHVAVDEKQPQRLAASTDDGIVWSTDGGKTWKELDKHLPYRVKRLPICFAQDRLVVGTAGSGVFSIALPASAGDQ